MALERFIGLSALALTFTSRIVSSYEDGLARTPPMGWRSWNLFHANVNQRLIESIAEAMAMKRKPDGSRSDDNNNSGISLIELGYSDVGLDDNWQECRKSNIENYFHDAAGHPIVNKELFPDMKGMVDKIHSFGLSAGWYHNNCICQEHNAPRWKGISHYEGDVNATIAFGFDSVKLDGCGAFTDLDLWYKLFAKASPGGKQKIMIENCHWGKTVPYLYENGTLWCPWHMYRSSADIESEWSSVFHNLQTTKQFQDKKNPLSRPGCWAYPDMLEVGLLSTFEEDRAHFGAWIITSSPLILSHDVRNDTLAERIWPIIANKEAIQINQEWAGHPGFLVKTTTGRGGKIIQVWAKPLNGGSFAVFVINNNEMYADDFEDAVLISIADILRQLDRPAQNGTMNVSDIWKYPHPSSVGVYAMDSYVQVLVQGHDSILLRFDPLSKSSGTES